MQAKDIIGKTITDIYAWVEYEQGGVDEGGCFLEIDKTLYVKIPYFDHEEILVDKIDERAKSIFSDQNIETVYHKEEKLIEDFVRNKGEERRAFFRQIGGHLKKMASMETKPKEDRPHKAETVEIKFPELKDRRIIDFIWDTDEDKKGLFLLDNGFLITETTMAPNGLALAGLNCFGNMEKLVNSGRYNYADLDRITYDIP